MRDIHDMPGHLARRFQQIAVAAFLAEVEEAGYDLTPVQCAALTAVGANPRIDQVTLAGLIAFDRTTITGVVDRLAQKGLVARHESSRDRRARELKITDAERRTLRGITSAVEAAQKTMLRGLTEKEAKELCGSCRKPSLPATTSVGSTTPHDNRLNAHGAGRGSSRVLCDCSRHRTAKNPRP
jgi:MarR family transcriptional regulator, temperature-dependent positive regulator of motility